MRPGSRDLVAFLDEEVLPRLTPVEVFPTVKWTSTSGRYWRGPCPIHGGDNPSAFSVDSVTKGWTCFSLCGNGSAVAFVHNHVHPSTPTGRDFVEAVRKLATLAGVPFPELERTEAEVKRDEERNRRETLLHAFHAFTQETLQGSTGKAAREYLANRGLEETAVEDLGLFTTREAVLAALTSKGFTKDEVVASGMVHDGRWEGRLIIPWRTRWGHLGTFAARDLTGKAEEAEKYLYMTGTRKADLVAFGLDRALQKGPDHLILVEGLLDVVNLQARGFSSVAAIGGNGREMTPERWEALAAFRSLSVSLVLDNDPKKDGTWPGYEGTLAAVENVLKVRNSINVPIYVLDPVFLGTAKDPDALVHKDGMEAFHAVLEKREPAALFMGRQYLRDITPGSPLPEKETAVRNISQFAGGLRGDMAAIYTETLLSSTSEATGYTSEAIQEEITRQRDRRLQEERARRMDAALKKATVDRARGEDPVAVAGDLMETLSSVHIKTVEEPPPFSVDRLERESKSATAGKSSGWEALDKLEASFNPGELTVFGARTGHCKTSVLVGLLSNFIKDTDENGREEVFLFYSQEEPEVRIYHRLLALGPYEDEEVRWSSAEVRDFLRGGYAARGEGYYWPDIPRLEGARETLRRRENFLRVIHRSSWTVEEIGDHARRMAARFNVKGILVDYLQRIPGPAGGKYDRRDIEVSTVARRLHDLAVDLAVPVIAGAQINREAIPDKYHEKLAKAKTYEDAKKEIKKARPALDHLREGGSEQEADLVLGLLSYAADYVTDEGKEDGREVPPVTLLEVGTLKNRYGIPGRWGRLAFEGKSTLVRDPEDEETL